MNTTSTSARLVRAALLLLALSTLDPQLSTVFAQGTAFTYQGRLTQGTNVANGTYEMNFSVWDNVSGPGQIGNAVTNRPVAVSNGLFTVALDFGGGIFTGSSRWLEIGVRTNGSTGAYTTLSPRQPLSAAPYAVMAGNAGNLGGQSSTAFVAKAGDTMTGPLNLPANGLMLAGNQLVASGGKIGIGTTSFDSLLTVGSSSMRGTLDVVGSSSGTAIPRISLKDSRGSGYQYSIYGGLAGTGSLDIFDDTAGAYRMTIRASGNVGIGTPSPAGALHVANGGIAVTGDSSPHSGTRGVYLDATDAGGYVFAYDYTTFTPKPLLLQAAGGNVGIGTPSPQAMVEIASGFGNPLIRFGHSANDYHYISAWYSDVPELNSVSFHIDNGAGGTTEAMRLRGNGSALIQASNNGDGAVLELRNNAPGLNENLGTINFTGSDGTSKGKIACFVDGGFYFTGGTVSVPVLQINGADVAEPFELSTKDIPKGSVVIIDEENPGQLKLSGRAYDTRVAGILSGANGINSGIRLKQQGFNDHGENVALSGRVYAQADASFGAIKPGDLLTTSDTPGHCMKVTDHARAQGAIIGKAMSALAEGKGMVLVLVSLQ